MDAQEYTYQAIRDQGYGRVWTRLAADRDEALAKASAWKREGMTGPGINGGEYFVQPVTETRHPDGARFYTPSGEAEAA